MGQMVRIGGAAQALISTGDALYRIDPAGGDIYLYNGAPDNWTKIGGPGFQFVGAGGFLYGITPDQGAVAWFDGSRWAWIGGPAQSLVGGGDTLYRVDPGGDIYCYNNSPDNWTKIGGPGFQFVGAGGNLYGITPDQGMVARFDGGGWARIGGPARSLIGGGDTVYSIDPAGDIYLYEGRPDSWTKIGGPGFQFAAAGSALVGITPDQAATASYEAGGWKQLGGPAAAITIAGGRIYTISPGHEAVWVYDESAPTASPSSAEDCRRVEVHYALQEWPHRTDLPDGSRIAIQLRVIMTDDLGNSQPWVKWFGLGADGVTMDARDTVLGPRNIFTVKTFHPPGQAHCYNLPWYCMQAANGKYVGYLQDGSARLSASVDLAQACLFGRGSEDWNKDVFFHHGRPWSQAQTYFDQIVSVGGYYALPLCATSDHHGGVSQWLSGEAPNYGWYRSGLVDHLIVVS